MRDSAPTPSAPSSTSPVAPRARPAQAPLNAVRGALIGMAELVPGVSGGTVALVTGVYERAIEAAHHLIAAAVALVKGPDRRAGFLQNLRRVDGWLVLPMLAGMAAAVLLAAGVVEHLVADNPISSRGLFFGLVAASLVVPIRLLPAGRGGAAGAVRDIAVVAVPAAVAFALVGLAGGGTLADPPIWMVFLAAAVAVCALVVPGVSGSFFLLAIGLYSPTLQAVDERDLGYVAVFGAGAVLGLLTIVQIISRLLHTHRRATLLAMTGLMLGSLRALWPWQGGTGSAEGHGALLAPSAPLAAPILLALAGAAVVIALIVVETRIARPADPRGAEQ
ncbi:membrane protein [Brachybacterium phenoliresistens]|uniref:Membrane protein n=1 Tax=Brachybacterium phenoliresistens TaxID=396014 RepID=Z9JUY7_9MICO|nr:DUF368 domain-containing protein [Brachybacterium phenoliresistens]EWS81858.1 membrane protein [Brachybacterium phenoliresistens]